LTTSSIEQTQDNAVGLAPTPDAAALRGLDERALLARYRRGDRRAFDELYRRCVGPVRAVCRATLGTPDLAEEAVQETFARAWVHLHSYDSRMPVEHWLCRVAKRLCIDVLRRRAREGVPAGESQEGLLDVSDPRTASAFEAVEARMVADQVVFVGMCPNFDSPIAPPGADLEAGAMIGERIRAVHVLEGAAHQEPRRRGVAGVVAAEAGGDPRVPDPPPPLRLEAAVGDRRSCSGRRRTR
jgi:RNA polymerase sigma factor (sigma-70 family)